MKNYFLFIFFFLFIGCSYQDTDKEYYTLNEAFKDPVSVKKLSLGDYKCRFETDRYFTLDSTIQHMGHFCPDFQYTNVFHSIFMVIPDKSLY